MLNRSVRPEIKELTTIKFPKIREFKFANGIEVSLYDRKDIDLIRMTVVTSGGMSASENPAIAVLSSLLNQEGTNSKTGKEISDYLERNGAWVQCIPQKHCRMFTILVLKEKWEIVLPVIYDILSEPAFPEKEFISMQSRLLIQAKTNEDTVGWKAEQLGDKMTFGVDHPYSKKCDIRSINLVSVNEVREFYKKYFNPGQIKIFVTGNLSDKMIDRLDDYFGKIKKNDNYSGIILKPFKPVTAPAIEFCGMPGKVQSALCLSVPIINIAEEDTLMLRMAVFALGGYFGSRLSQNIREKKGLTYGISAMMKIYPPERVIRIWSECANEYIEDVLSEIEKELIKIGDSLMSDDEISIIRKAEISNLAEVVSTPFNIMDFFCNAKILNLGLEYYDKRLQTALEITPEKIMTLADRYMNPNKLLTAIAGYSK